MEIIFNNDDIVVLVKPRGIPSQADKSGDLDLITIAEKNLNSEIYPIHRLDRPVGGVMVYAKNKTSASKFSRLIQRNELKKEYLAVVCGRPIFESQRLRDFIEVDKRRNLSKIVGEKTKNSKEAILIYDLIEYNREENLSLLRVRLLTGRHHQIRLQLSNHNIPIWGDNKYNPQKFQRGAMAALWSYSITLPLYNGEETRFSNAPIDYPFSLFEKILKNF